MAGASSQSLNPNPTVSGAITSAVGLNPQVNQIYPIVNSIYKQMTGQEGIQAVDTASLVAMGTQIILQGKVDLWLNTLAQRIGYTIDGYRVYRNHFSRLYRTQMEWGGIVQKLTAEMPEAVFDMTYDVGQMDGQSVDQWIIANPKVHQRFFDKETPYSFFITTQTALLKEAFLNAGAMASLINQIFGKVENKIELVLEDLARIAVVNFVLNLKPSQEYHLVTMYNNTNPPATVTMADCRHNADFLHYVTGVINNASRKMESMSVLYNSDGFERFTPKADQHLYMLADFMTILETVSSYAAYHDNYVMISPEVQLPYWQAVKSGSTNPTDFTSITTISGTVDGAVVTKTNLIGLLFDHDAIGTFRQEEDVLTTPVNARARYYNTFWHEKQLWFNDMSENGVAFYLD